MALLKRKRSAAQLFPPSTPDSSMMMVLDAPALHSRTLKRYRDNRPSDEEVHQHTLDLLYSAQQRQQQQQQQDQHHHHHHHQHQDGAGAVAQGLALSNQMLPVSSSSDPSPLPTPTTTSSSTHDGQQSLHRFWNIGSQPSSDISSPSLADPLSAPTPTACDDCGAPLAGSDGAGSGDDGMDLDGSAAQDTACGACGKHVCFSCSVSNLGEEKRCLQCAGRRVWIGGIGWTNAGVSVC
ncbi:hypothetical protein V8C44DRAFT_334949 [Trichoderma aethiopicum]